MRTPDTHGLRDPALADVWRSRDKRIGGSEPTIAAYLIRAPYAHPFWDWHVLAVIHLRDHPDYGPARHIAFPGASHEVLVTALNPERDGLVNPDDASSWDHMNPHDFVGQVMLADDVQAARLAELLAFAVADGNLVPDSDHREWWKQVLATTAEHVRLGGHPG